MTWFYLVFPILMISSPLLFVLLFRPRLRQPEEEAAALERARRLTWILSLATLGAIGLSLVLRQYILPQLATQVWICCFPLWFGLAMPIINLKYPALATCRPTDSPTRSASLRPREIDLPISPYMWLLPWSVWLAGVVAVVWSIGRAGDDVNLWSYLSPVIFQATTAVVLAIGPWCLRMLADEAEPLDAAGSTELTEGYRALRRFRVGGMFWLMFVGLAAISTAMALATVWGFNGPAIGLAGGVIGTVFGIAGGVFGTIAGIRRARLTEMLQRLSAQTVEPAS